ncbi:MULTISPECIES: paraquat-inducible protein A [Marinobacter]|uniref:paraquat-inducible protein A n=1 Tax=Marinobacter TaxID=2742 RepID=UPI000DAC4695|nr:MULTISPECIES: paraquat-inducible protein A [Marinobacter]
MSELSDLIICEYCDAVYQRPRLHAHQRANCRRCGGVLARPHLFHVDHLLALCLTAVLLVVFLGVSPVLVIQTQGQAHPATLFDAVWALTRGPTDLLALVAGFSVILVPLVQVALMSWILGFAHFRQKAPGFRGCMRTLTSLSPWSMLEVFLLGALVTVFKITGRIEVLPTLGLAALAGLSLLIIGMAGRDIHRLWDELP